MYFASLATGAIPNVGLEDDLILVLHRRNLDTGGVRDMGVRGYGEHSMSARRGGESDDCGDGGPSLAWKDKAAGGGVLEEGGRTVTATCANCGAVLVFVSDCDPGTYRLYKHLLDCEEGTNGTIHGPPHEGHYQSARFAEKYTIQSFLTREMIRYAESEAVCCVVV